MRRSFGPRGRAALVAGSLTALAGLGCSLQVSDSAARPSVVNSCVSARDCAVGPCTQGICTATQGQIDVALFEIIPDAPSIPDSGIALVQANAAILGWSFFSPQSGLSSGDLARGIRLPQMPAFTGKVAAAVSNVPRGCASLGAANSPEVDVGAHIEFTPTPMLDGVPVQGATAYTTAVDTDPTYFNFAAALVPSIYDVYVQPSCDMAPLLVSGLEVGESVNTSLPPAVLELPAETKLSGSLRRLDNISLEDWQVSLVEPHQGRRISTIQRLGAISPDTNATNFSLNYQPVLRPASSASQATATTGFGSPFIRIEPPANAVAPTVYWQLAAVIHSDQQISLDMTGVPGTADLVRLRGTVRGPDGAGTPSSMYLLSSSLLATKSSGLFTSFNRTSVPTDAGGAYSVQVLPGDYRIVVVPNGAYGGAANAQGAVLEAGQDSPWAVSEELWTVGSDAEQNHDFVLAAKIAVGGAVGAPGGEAAGPDTTVSATPVLLPAHANVLRDALGKTAFVPPTASSSVDSAGAFRMSVNPGTFDLAVIPSQASAFPRWIRPGLTIDPGVGEVPGPVEATLGTPVAIFGQLLDASGAGPLANATLRAYAKAPDGTRAVEVAATESDDTGRFRLLMPASFTP